MVAMNKSESERLESFVYCTQRAYDEKKFRSESEMKCLKNLKYYKYGDNDLMEHSCRA